MLPLHDDNPTRRFAWVTLAIIALNVAAFLFWEPTFTSGPSKDQKQAVFFYCHAEVPWEVTHQENLAEGGGEAVAAMDQQDPLGPGDRADYAGVQRVLQGSCPSKSWWQSVFVAMFLHGGWLHIGGNMLFLWIFGNNVEDRLGPLLFFPFYIAAGLAASIAQLLIDTNSTVPNLGASGAIAGVLGAYLVMFPRRRVLTLVIFIFITAIWLPAWVVLGAWFILQLFSGVGAVTAHVSSGVAFFAHIGGFAFGALLALLFFPKEGLGRRPPPPTPGFQRRGLGWGRR